MSNLSICSDKCEIVHVFMFEVIFDRNGAKVYVKKSTNSLSRKIRETWFLESPWHSSIASGSVTVVSYCDKTTIDFSFDLAWVFTSQWRTSIKF